MKTTTPSNGTLDLAYIRLVANGNEPFEAEMLLSLQSEISRKMEAMRYDLEAGHREGIRLCAHTLKNLYGLLGIHPLQDAFLLMETESMSVNNAWLTRQFFGCQHMWETVQQDISVLLTDYNNRVSLS